MYILYKTVNKINGKYYIGVHKTNNVNDSYLGSGTALKAAIKSYGRKNFYREILFIFNTQQEVYAAEKIIVNLEFILSESNYNLTEGGIRSLDSFDDNRVYKERHTQKNRFWINNGITSSLIKKEDGIPDGWSRGRIQKDHAPLTEEQIAQKSSRISISNKGRVSPMKGKTLTEEDKHKKSISALNREKQLCDYCNKNFDPGNYKKWHGEKCKLKCF